jgi:exosome complex component RRP41
MGVFAQADGSAYIEQGNTKALAVVYGPHEASGRLGSGGAAGTQDRILPQ